MKNLIFKTVFMLVLLVISMSSALAQIPEIRQVEDQHILCDEQFATINLRSMVYDSDNDPSEITFKAYDYHSFGVSIEDGIATIHNPGISRKEFIGFRAIDPDGNMAVTKGTFSSTGCWEQRQREEIILPPAPHPRPHPIPDVPVFRAIPFIPDGFFAEQPHSCAISTGHGLLPDTDCDRIPDEADNCPAAPNPKQRDQNRNGLGDACDLVITQFKAQPQKLSCGNAIMASATIINNHPVPLRDVELTAKLPGTGGNQGLRKQFMKVIEPGSATNVELTSRIPLQAEPGRYDLTLTANYNVPEAGFRGKTIVADSIEVDDKVCTTGSDESVLELLEIQDAKDGKAAVYEIKITNTDDRSHSYEFNVQGLSGFGTYSMNPGSLAIIEGRETETIHLYVWPSESASGGRTFVFEARQGEYVEQITLTTQFLESEEEGTNYFSFILGGIAIIFVFGAILAVLGKTSSNRLVLDTRGEKRSTLPVARQQTSIRQFDQREKNRQKVAKVGVDRERGWLYYVDKQGDVSRSRMKWAKQSS